MRRLLLLLLLSASLPAMAGGNNAASTSANPTQNNENFAQSQSQASQSNQSRSESVGGSIINQQFNDSIGELSQTTISENVISCESGSFYVSAGAYPQDEFGFYTFQDRKRSQSHQLNANVGFQIPFGPSIASCVSAQKNKARQVSIGTEAGILKTCLSTKVAALAAEVDMQALTGAFPQLTKSCSTVWGIAQVGKP